MIFNEKEFCKQAMIIACLDKMAPASDSHSDSMYVGERFGRAQVLCSIYGTKSAESMIEIAQIFFEKFLFKECAERYYTILINSRPNEQCELVDLFCVWRGIIWLGNRGA